MQRSFQWASVALALVLLATTLASRTSLVDTHLLNIMGEEQNVVYGLIAQMQDGPLYSDPEQLPMTIVQYGPLYYYIVGGVGTLCGVDATEPQAVYILGRAMGLLFNALFCLTCFLLARRMGAMWWAALLWAVVLFSFLPRQVYSRPDALNLLLFGCGMLALFRSAQGGHRSPWPILLAVACGCLATLGKQSGMLGLGVVGCCLAMAGRWRLLALGVAAGLLLLATATAGLCWHYGTDVIYKNLVLSLHNGIDLRLLRSILSPRFLGMFMVQALGLFMAWRWWRQGDHVQRAWALAFPLCLVFGYLTSMKFGSSHAYYMEGLLLACAAAAHVQSRMQGAVAQVAMVVMAALFVHPPQLLWGIHVLLGGDRVANEHEQYARAASMAAELRTDPAFRDGAVFVAAIDHLDNFLVGRSVLPQKNFFWLGTTRTDYDLSAFERALDDGTIRYVVAPMPVERSLFPADRREGLVPLGVRHGYHVYMNPAVDPGDTHLAR